MLHIEFAALEREFFEFIRKVGGVSYFGSLDRIDLQIMHLCLTYFFIQHRYSVPPFGFQTFFQ